MLTMFREQPFVYTLDPPKLADNAMDEFLFETRRGFCEHYSSAFVVLMRAAGIPARVVTGYTGGYRNPIGDYWIVRRSDAHAWAEVWLEGRGWTRVAIFADTTGYGEAGLKDVEAALAAKNLKAVHVARFPLGVKDLKEPLKAAQAAGANVVFSYTVGPENATIARTFS